MEEDDSSAKEEDRETKNQDQADMETIYPEVSYFLWAAIHCLCPHVSIPIPLILHLERLAQSQCQLMVKNLFEVALNIHPLYQ